MKRIRRGLGGKDHKLNRAITEILERGNVPSPDRVFEGRVHVSLDRLNLQYGPDLFRRLEDGRYALKLHDKRKAVTGTITHRGVTHEITQGQGWYDHEFGVGEREDVDDEAEARLDEETRK